MIAPGYYRTRLVRHGVWVPVVVFRPCRIELEPETWQWLDRWPRLLCMLDDQPANLAQMQAMQVVDPADYLPEEWRPAYERFPNVQPVPIEVYLFLCADRAWARRHAPDDPAANPRTPANTNKLPVPF